MLAESASELDPLTGFQVAVAKLFFTLPASERFLLAGGAALVAQHLTSRPTQDLDFFTREGADVPLARDQLEVAALGQGWAVERIQDGDTFCRLLVHGPEDLVVDLALDSPPLEPATASVLGPTFAPRELAGRKLLALFDRAAARDFADVFVLADSFSKVELIASATLIDAGFDESVLADGIATLARFTDDEIPIDTGRVDEFRSFFVRWRAELLRGSSQR